MSRRFNAAVVDNTKGSRERHDRSPLGSSTVDPGPVKGWTDTASPGGKRKIIPSPAATARANPQQRQESVPTATERVTPARRHATNKLQRPSGKLPKSPKSPQEPARSN